MSISQCPIPLPNFTHSSWTWLSQFEILGLIGCDIQLSSCDGQSRQAGEPARCWTLADRVVHQRTPTQASLLRYYCIAYVPKALSKRDAQRREAVEKKIHGAYGYLSLGCCRSQGNGCPHPTSTWKGAAAYPRRCKVQVQD